jgi:hypothetical protein
MEAGERVAHFPFKLRPRGQRRDTVENQHVDGAGAHQRVGDFQRLLARVGLGKQQIFNLDAKFLGIDRTAFVLFLQPPLNKLIMRWISVCVLVVFFE